MTPSSIIPPAELSALEGGIGLTSIPDILQFLNIGSQTGELRITETALNISCRIYFQTGEIVHAETNDEQGASAIVQSIDWVTGYFRFKKNLKAPHQTIQLPFQHLLMEVLRIKDEWRKAPNMADNQRTSSDVLQDLLKIPGIVAVVVVGRDGFLIESTGNSGAVDLDSIGASLAHAINGIEEMGDDLKVDKFTDVFFEYRRAVIMCSPIGDAVVALVSPDASKLGIIRHKARKTIEELAHYF